MNHAKTILVAAAAAFAVTTAPAAIIFDDFNVDEGHFASAVNLSGTTVGEDPASSADRVEDNGPFEGLGHQQLILIHDESTTPFRLRHLSGGGTPANNISFTTGAGTDGFIGFYLKTTATGWETSINLDSPSNVGADMRGSISVPIIGDGEWHLYEWDLDAANWGSVPGIATIATGPLPDNTWTIDSIYFRDMDGTPGPTATIYLDFVAKSDSGSIAALVPVPEPSALALSVLGGFGLLLGVRRFRK